MSELTRSEKVARCQEAVGYRFRESKLLETALTHTSAAATSRDSNERMEFLGDAVLGLVITEKLYRTSTEGHVRMMGRVLNGLELSREGRVCIIRYTQQDLQECNAEQEDASGIINAALEIESVCVVAQLSERNGLIKCSMRAKAPYDVAAVAKNYGGGGHVRAAGCSLPDKTLEEACAEMEAALANIL